MDYRFDNGNQGNPFWDGLESWEDLLQAILAHSTYSSSADLAAAICAEAGRETEQDLDSITRNVTNWRNGTHIPNRKNFMTLTRILKVKDNEDLLAIWNRLYAEKQKRKAKPFNGVHMETGFTGGTENGFDRGRWRSYGVIAILIGLFSATSATLFWANAPLTVDTKSTKVEIPFQPDLQLKVGESAIVHGHRNKCGQGAPGPSNTKNKLPGPLKYGELSVGGVGMRYSRACQDFTPSRAVVYTATSVGIETFELFGDRMKVTISE